MKAIDPGDLRANWPDRERQWRKELGRIRLGVEPIADQMERIRGVNLVLSCVCGGIALIFVAIFSAFRHVGLGFLIANLLMVPAELAWVKYASLRRRVGRYLREREAMERRTMG